MEKSGVNKHLNYTLRQSIGIYHQVPPPTTTAPALGAIHFRRFDTYPPPISSFLVLSVGKFGQFFTPLPPQKCWGFKWMVPYWRLFARHLLQRTLLCGPSRNKYQKTCWKPPETIPGGFAQVSDFFYYKLFSIFIINKKILKPENS